MTGQYLQRPFAPSVFLPLQAEILSVQRGTLGNPFVVCWLPEGAEEGEWARRSFTTCPNLAPAGEGRVWQFMGEVQGLGHYLAVTEAERSKDWPDYIEASLNSGKVAA